MSDPASRILTTLHAAWENSAHLHGLPPVTVIYGRSWGHSYDATTVTVPPITHKWPTDFAPGATLLGGLLHEAAHLICLREHGNDGTSRQGRYHGAQFAHHAERIGLSVARATNIGHRTDLGSNDQRFRERVLKARGSDDAGSFAPSVYTRLLDELVALARKDAWTPRGAEPERDLRGARRVSARCGCIPARTLHMRPRQFAAGPVTCGVCGQPFTVGSDQ